VLGEIVLKEQSVDQVVDVGQWPADDEALAVYPEGAREKSLLICPPLSAEHNYNFCIPGYRYLFKRSRSGFPEQYWIEIFAYQLGCLVGVTVPSAFVAYNSNTREAGALIEWFYIPKEEKYISGGDILQARIEEFDRKKGEKHNFQSIVDALNPEFWKLEENWIQNFAKMIIFDALIGNTDRHQDNWGVITNFTVFTSRISPAFDNGTSMGHEIQEKKFSQFDERVRLEKYVNKGKPHLKWDLNEEHKFRGNQDALLLKVLDTYPNFSDLMLSCLNFKREQIEEMLERLVRFNVPVRLTKNRARFMLNLLCYRQKHLLSMISEFEHAFP